MAAQRWGPTEDPTALIQHRRLDAEPQSSPTRPDPAAGFAHAQPWTTTAPGCRLPRRLGPPSQPAPRLGSAGPSSDRVAACRASGTLAEGPHPPRRAWMIADCWCGSGGQGGPAGRSQLGETSGPGSSSRTTCPRRLVIGSVGRSMAQSCPQIRLGIVHGRARLRRTVACVRQIAGKAFSSSPRLGAGSPLIAHSRTPRAHSSAHTRTNMWAGARTQSNLART